MIDLIILRWWWTLLLLVVETEPYRLPLPRDVGRPVLPRALPCPLAAALPYGWAFARGDVVGSAPYPARLTFTFPLYRLPLRFVG